MSVLFMETENSNAIKVHKYFSTNFNKSEQNHFIDATSHQYAREIAATAVAAVIAVTHTHAHIMKSISFECETIRRFTQQNFINHRTNWTQNNIQ